MLTLSMSAFRGKADIPDTPHQWPLMTQSGPQGCAALASPETVLQGGRPASIISGAHPAR